MSLLTGAIDAISEAVSRAAVTIPALEMSGDNDLDALRATVQALREGYEILTGQRGDPLDTVLTRRDFLDGGFQIDATLGFPYAGNVGIVLPGGGTIPSIPETIEDDYTTPPRLVNVEAVAALTTILLTWDDPHYTNWGVVEVWRASTDDLGAAIRVGTTTANIYLDPIGLTGTGFYYWVRIVSRVDIEGPFQDVAGAFAQTGLVDGTDLSDAIITAEKLADGSVGAGAIIDGAVVAGKLAANAIIAGDGVIANAAIGAAQIGSVSADTITSGFLAAARILAGSLSADKITANSITTAQIQAGGIHGDRIQARTIAADRIAANTITAAEIAAGGISADRISVTSLAAIKSTLGAVTAGEISASTVYGGAYTSAYSWPAAGAGGGFHLGPSGLLLGNGNGGAGSSGYFQVTSAGNVYAPNFSIVNGVMSIAQANVINTVNIAGEAVTIPRGQAALTDVYGVGANITVDNAIAGKRIILMAWAAGGSIYGGGCKLQRWNGSAWETLAEELPRRNYVSDASGGWYDGGTVVHVYTPTADGSQQFRVMGGVSGGGYSSGVMTSIAAIQGKR